MQSDFWIQRWREGQIGFHQDRVNPYLEKHWPRVRAPKGARVLVPLCGKSLDMLWLRDQGYKVVGVELSALAIDTFITENKLTVQRDTQDNFSRCISGDITLLCGDFFDYAPAVNEHIDVVYDRASLIALPPDMRQRYARHLTRLLPAGKRVLLVTLEYPQQQMQGPPFAVTAQEVHDLYANAFDIECVETLDTLAENPRFQSLGVSSFLERIFVMTRR